MHEVNLDAERELSAETEECSELIGICEALLFASVEPLGLERIVEVTQYSETQVLHALEKIKLRCAGPDYGFELTDVANGFQLRTKAQFAGFIRELKAGLPRRLTAQALETLAIVAYRQPIVKSDIEKLRGVDATPTIKTLLERNLIKIVGHQESVGQPALYGTTDEFLKIFGLKSTKDLPNLRDLRELERDPGETGAESESQENELKSATNNLQELVGNLP